MYTLSITQAHQKLRETVETFEGVTAYKVEFGLWDHLEKPYVQLYVNCKVNEESHFLHAQADTFYQALQTLKNCYQEISRQDLVVETDELLF